MSNKLVYCVYLTIFSGSELPPFYIGSSNILKINNGYHGSVVSKDYKNIWKKQLTYCPEKFKTIILSYHPTRKEAARREREILKYFNCAEHPLYINKTNGGSEFFAGKTHTDKIKKLMSAAQLGKKLSNETKNKMSQAHKGRKKSPEAIQKMLETRRANGSYKTPWNKGKKGLQTSWNKGLTKETDARLQDIGTKISSAKKASDNTSDACRQANITRSKNGYIPWNKGLTKEDPRVAAYIDSRRNKS